ncbi:DNA-3-methyladenine glycosylase 2 family protein [Nakamurella sp. YIM 132087]|uniref:DNA-3-methyladenine glycosylase 2 family protein n=1 Tax=Nakamurella alba TaxID=2665158 RepID=A0A7K1FG02_9ACTN|nr:DNA-3-methyladenine glycosylase [Nakamurella alba]MTD13045.1 DNA-3-methyladenine glycosylase 2 family protein [Nakamurella alba]
MTTFTLRPSGRYSLRESAEFGFGQREAERFDGVMRLAFCSDEHFRPVGVALTRPGDGDHADVHATAVGPGRTLGVRVESVRAQVARILSLDGDVAAYEAIAERDPVIADLQRVAPGLLPPLFHSAYEAAMWAVLSARRPAKVAATVRQALSESLGTVLHVAGRPMAVLPSPRQILTVPAAPRGIDAERWHRLQGVARAADEGRLDVHRLRQLGPEGAKAELLRIKGIGPFYSSLVVIRALGWTDVLPTEEPLLREAVGRLYHLGHAASVAELEEIADAWRPMRTWASVLVRAAHHRLGAGV